MRAALPRRLVWILLLSVVLVRPGLVDASSIAGAVVDREDRPVAGARIEATLEPNPEQRARQRLPIRWVAHSDEGGLFELVGLPTGWYSLLVSKDGWAPARARALSERLRPRQSILIELAPGGTIRGRTVDPQGTPLAGIKVAIPAFRLQTETDGTGRFVLEHVPAGEQRLAFRGRGRAAASRSAMLAEAAVVDLPAVALEPAATLGGAIVDEDGRPIAGAWVRLKRPGDRAPPVLAENDEDHWSDDSGAVLFSDLEPGQEYYIAAHHPDFADL
jgi:hypothetical protein